MFCVKICKSRDFIVHTRIGNLKSCLTVSLHNYWKSSKKSTKLIFARKCAFPYYLIANKFFFALTNSLLYQSFRPIFRPVFSIDSSNDNEYYSRKLTSKLHWHSLKSTGITYQYI